MKLSLERKYGMKYGSADFWYYKRPDNISGLEGCLISDTTIGLHCYKAKAAIDSM